MRVTYRITEDDDGMHVRFSLWVNGVLICAPGELCLRKDEFEPFIQKLGAILDSEWYKQENPE